VRRKGDAFIVKGAARSAIKDYKTLSDNNYIKDESDLS
jgi:hypothetical protein